jgi:hypothetical protein
MTKKKAAALRRVRKRDLRIKRERLKAGLRRYLIHAKDMVGERVWLPPAKQLEGK